MATKQLVTKVWIAPGCIVCDACETESPEVFEVRHDEGTCLIRPAALEAEFCKARSQSIIDAAIGCPVDVIKYDTIAVEVSDEEAAAAPAKAAPAAVDEKVPAAPGAKAHPDKPVKKPHDGPKHVDPAIQALLAAATARGGKAMMDKPIAGTTANLKRIQTLPVDKLPPDARHVKMLEKTKPAKPGDVSRRDMVLAAAWGGMAVVGGFSGVALGRFLMPNVLEEPDPKVRLGPMDKFQAMAPGEVNEDYKNSGKFWIIRDNNNRIAALSIVCTHLGCVPTWLPNDRKFKCPCHGSGFKADGTNFEGPTPRPLERFRIYLEAGNVIVDRSKKFLAMGPNDTAVWNDPDAFIEV